MTVRFMTVLFALLIIASHAHAQDVDADGVPDVLDNCSTLFNPDQRDSNVDGFGNACDADLTNDGFVNLDDLVAFKAVFFTADADADFDGDDFVSLPDLIVFKAAFFMPPGPGAAPANYTTHVQPILGAKCSPCHTGSGVGGHDVGTVYADALEPSDECPGLTIGECALVRIQNGSMPAGRGCTGDPVLDAGNDACLTADEQSIVQNWIDNGQQQ